MLLRARKKWLKKTLMPEKVEEINAKIVFIFSIAKIWKKRFCKQHQNVIIGATWWNWDLLE